MTTWQTGPDGQPILEALTGYQTAAASGVGVAVRVETATGHIQLVMSVDQALEMSVDLASAASRALGKPDGKPN